MNYRSCRLFTKTQELHLLVLGPEKRAVALHNDIGRLAECTMNCTRFIFYSSQARHLKLVREDSNDYDSDDENPDENYGVSIIRKSQ